MAELLTFTAEHVCRLTGLSPSQLRYWDKTEFFSPTLVDDFRRFGRIYSFRDVVGLRTISILRNEHGVSLQELRKVGAWLHQRHSSPWASLRFSLCGKRVLFTDPETGVMVEPRGQGQTVIAIDLEPIAADMGAAASRLRERERGQIGKIVKNRYVVHNSNVLAGTRVRTAAIWNFHQAGYSRKAILAEYPRLQPKDIKAALEFEAKRHRRRAA